MPTTLHLKCGGCDAEAHSKPFRKEFVSVTGRSYGIGSWQTPKIDDIVPEGWTWSDPFTACTYCPECWKGIVESDNQTNDVNDDCAMGRISRPDVIGGV